MSPTENKRAKRRKNKKSTSRTGLTNAVSPQTHLNSLHGANCIEESTATEGPVEALNLNAPIVNSSNSNLRCFQCQRPQSSSLATSSQTGSSLLGCATNSSWEDIETQNLMRQQGIWFCEDCEKSFDLKGSYESFLVHQNIHLASAVCLTGANPVPEAAKELERFFAAAFAKQTASEIVLSSAIPAAVASISTEPSIPSRKGVCHCGSCCEQRMLEAEEKEQIELKRGWKEVKFFLHHICQEEGLHTGPDPMGGSGDATPIQPSPQTTPTKKKKKPDSLSNQESLRDWVRRLCKNDPHHLYLCLESQMKYFIDAMRCRLLRQLTFSHSLPNNTNEGGCGSCPPDGSTIDRVSPIPDSNSTIAGECPCCESKDMLTLWLLHEYQKLCAASKRFAPIVEELESAHLKCFNLSWELVNRHLFQSIVYSDSVLRHRIENCSCSRQCYPNQKQHQQSPTKNSLGHTTKCVRQHSPIRHNSECLTPSPLSKLDDEMTVIAVMWREAQQLIEEYKRSQDGKEWELFRKEWKILEQGFNSRPPVPGCEKSGPSPQLSNIGSPGLGTCVDELCIAVQQTQSLPSNPSGSRLPTSSTANGCGSLSSVLRWRSNSGGDESFPKLSFPIANCSLSSSSSSSSLSNSSCVGVISQPAEGLKMLLKDILPKQKCSNDEHACIADLSSDEGGPLNWGSSGVFSQTSVPTSHESANCCHKHHHHGQVPYPPNGHPKGGCVQKTASCNHNQLGSISPVKKKPLTQCTALHASEKARKECPTNNCCECHTCKLRESPVGLPSAPLSGHNTLPSGFGQVTPPVPSYPPHLGDLARSTASQLASKAPILPHLYNVHARKLANSIGKAEAWPLPPVCEKGSGETTWPIDFELPPQELFRAQGCLNWDPTAIGDTTHVKTCFRPTTPPLPPPIHSSNSPTGSNFGIRSRLGSNGEICVNNTTQTVESHSIVSHIPTVGTNTTATLDQSPTNGLLNCASQTGNSTPIKASSLSQTDGNMLNGTTTGPVTAAALATLAANATVNKGTGTTLVTQQDQEIMTDGGEKSGATADCPLSARHYHHHHHHNSGTCNKTSTGTQCCESGNQLLPPPGGGNVDGDESGLDDSCSERSSSTSTSNPRESRVCDCCYCEVFGHGVPVVAPVSRNYPEIRERLRLRLSKRKAESGNGNSKVPQKPCAAVTNPLPPFTPSIPKGRDMVDERELDDLLRYINGTDEENEVLQQHQRGCTGICKDGKEAKSSEGRETPTGTVNAKPSTKKHRKKGKKATGDEPSDNKVETVGGCQRKANSEQSLVDVVKEAHILNALSAPESKSSSHGSQKRNKENASPVPAVKQAPKKLTSIAAAAAAATESSANGHCQHSRTVNKKQHSNQPTVNEVQLFNGDIKESNSKGKGSKCVAPLTKRAPQQPHLVNSQENSSDSSATSGIETSHSPILAVRKTVLVSNGIAAMEKDSGVTLKHKKNSVPNMENGALEALHSSALVAEQLKNTLQAPSPRSKKNKKKKNCLDDTTSPDEVFLPKDIDLDNGELDEVEKELEAFKRFCMASVPLANKEKVQVNLKDIVFKRKSNSGGAQFHNTATNLAPTAMTQ